MQGCHGYLHIVGVQNLIKSEYFFPVLLGRQTIIQPEELYTFAAADDSLSPTRMTANGTPIPASPIRVVSAVPVKTTPPPPRSAPVSRPSTKRVWRSRGDSGTFGA